MNTTYTQHPPKVRRNMKRAHHARVRELQEEARKQRHLNRFAPGNRHMRHRESLRKAIIRKVVCGSVDARRTLDSRGLVALLEYAKKTAMEPQFLRTYPGCLRHRSEKFAREFMP